VISLVEFFIAKSAVCYCCSSIIIDINRKIGKECTFQLLIIVYEVRSSDICLVFISVFGSLCQSYVERQYSVVLLKWFFLEFLLPI
jgi:hypothetical protein